MYDQDQKADVESAVQYNIMDPDPPHTLKWRGKLKNVAAALRELDDFLGSEEAAGFVKQRVRAGFVMDTDDLEFWEANLN